jgi:hypothetical protein
MAEVSFNSPSGLSQNGGAVIHEGNKPEIEDDGWVPVLPSKPVINDGGSHIAPAAARGEPVSNDGRATVYRHRSDGRTLVPGHVSNVEVKIVDSPAMARAAAQVAEQEALAAASAPPKPFAAPVPNSDAQPVQRGAAINASNDVTIGGGGRQEDHAKEAGKDHVALGGAGRPIRK